MLIFYDSELFYRENNLKQAKFTLVYIGTLSRGRSLKVFGEALNRLVSKNIIKKNDLEIVFYGTEQNLIEESFGYQALSDSIKHYNWSPANAVAIAQRNATLLLHTTLPGIITGKIMEYLGVRRPIITTPGDELTINRLFKTTNAGIVCPDVPSSELIFRDCYNEWKESGTVKYQGIETEIEKFSYKNLSGQMAGLLDKIIRN